MKKNLLLLVLILVMGSTLAACGGGEEPSTSSPEAEDNIEDRATQEKESGDKPVEVDKGLFDVELTLAASFFAGQDIDQVIAKAEEDGVNEVTVNDDGSLTYKMSKSTHQKILKNMENSLLESIEGMKNDFQSINDIRHNKSFSEFTLVVDKAAYENSFDGFAALGLGMSGMLYQLYDGVKPDENKVKINIEDEETGEVFNTVTYPDALEKN